MTNYRFFAMILENYSGKAQFPEVEVLELPRAVRLKKRWDLHDRKVGRLAFFLLHTRLP